MSLAYEIARALSDGKNPEKNGDGYTCKCPAHGDRNNSMSIKDDGNDGVLVHCFTGCRWQDIKDELVRLGLHPEWQPTKGEHKKHEKRNGKKQEPAENHHEEKAKEEPRQERKEKESFVWKQADRNHADDIGRYLRDERRINIADIPLCLKWGTYTDKESGETVSMIVAAASKPDDKKVYAVQRLFIDPETNKKTGAKMLGECEGRGVWFDRSGDLTEIIVGEGIETTLSAMVATGRNGVATLSTSGMKALIFPDQTETIFICADSDPVREKEAASMPGQKAACFVAQAFEESREGRTAYIMSPDDSCFTTTPGKLDFNDLLKEDDTGESIRKRFAAAIPFKELSWAPEQATTDEPVDGTYDDDSYPPSTLKKLHKLNKNFAAVILGSDFRIAKEGFDEDGKKHTLDFLKINTLYSYYANHKVKVYVDQNKNTEYRELAKVWMAWPERRTYDGVIFDPSEKASKSAYNLYRGFPLQPKQGDWSKMRKHIIEVICNHDLLHFEYLMAWMARAVQDPGGDKPGVAVVMKGGKGIGKGVFADYFGSIFGESYLALADSDSFTGKFNMHLSKALVVFLDEAVWGGDKKAEGKLKQLVTEPRVLFEPKGIDSISMRNFMNIIIASNEEWVVPATGDERRWFVLKPSEAFQKDTKYFGAIKKEQYNGGAEAMMYDLLRYDYSKVDLRLAPQTEGLAEQVCVSMNSVEQFWLEVIDREYLLSDRETGTPKKTHAIEPESVEAQDLWPVSAFKYEVREEYKRWCVDQKIRHPENNVHFWRKTWQVWHDGYPERRCWRKDSNGRRFDAILVPDIEKARDSFSGTTKVHFSHNTNYDHCAEFNNQF